MIAWKQQGCPRCDAPILPGQVIVPQPRGWTHASCVSGADDE